MIKITIPYLPPSLNKWSRMHWAEASNIKKQWEHDIYYLFNQQRFDNREILPLTKAKVRIKLYFKDKRIRDKDNYTPKFILDGLVKTGILADDNADVIGQTEIIFGFDKTDPRTEIEVWRCN